MKMMTRKILAMLLTVVMVLSLAACGKQNDTNNGDNTNNGDDANTGDTTTKVTLQVAYENNPGEPIDDAVNKWKELVDELSNGTIELQLFPSSQLGSKSDLMDQIVMGEPIITVCDGSFLADYGAPELAITSAPYVFDNFDQCWKVIASDWWAEQAGLLEQNGIHIVTTNWIFGERNIITTKPVKTVDDMKGLILRTPNTPSYVKAFELMGAAPTAMAIGDCYTALQQGTIDGLENTYSTLYGGAYYEVAKYMTTTHHVNMFCQWICSQSVWESLTDEQRTILSETGDEAGLFNNDVQTSSAGDFQQKIVDSGVTLIDLTDEERAGFAEAVRPLYSDPTVTSQWRDGLYDMIQDMIK